MVRLPDAVSASVLEPPGCSERLPCTHNENTMLQTRIGYCHEHTRTIPWHSLSHHMKSFCVCADAQPFYQRETASDIPRMRSHAHACAPSPSEQGVTSKINEMELSNMFSDSERALLARSPDHDFKQWAVSELNRRSPDSTGNMVATTVRRGSVRWQQTRIEQQSATRVLTAMHTARTWVRDPMATRTPFRKQQTTQRRQEGTGVTRRVSAHHGATHEAVGR